MPRHAVLVVPVSVEFVFFVGAESDELQEVHVPHAATAHTHTYIHTYIRVFIRTLMHTYIHTYIPVQVECGENSVDVCGREIHLRLGCR